MSSTRKNLRSAVMVAAIALVVATRVPGGSDASGFLVAIGATVLVGLVVAVTFLPKTPTNLRPFTYIWSLGFFLVPPSTDAALAIVPAWVVAVLFLLALHLFFHSERRDAPIISPHHAWGRHHVLRFLPVVVVGGVFAGVPLLLKWLPLRIHAVHELQTALIPVLAAVLIGGLVVFAAGLRSLIRRSSLLARRVQSRKDRKAEGVEAQ